MANEAGVTSGLAPKKAIVVLTINTGEDHA